MFRRSRARDRPKPWASPRVVRGAREPGQQGRQAEVWRQAAGGGRPQPGVRPTQLRRLHAEADQHQGRPGGRQLDGDGALNLHLLHLLHFPRRGTFTFSVNRRQNSSFLRNLLWCDCFKLWVLAQMRNPMINSKLYQRSVGENNFHHIVLDKLPTIFFFLRKEINSILWIWIFEHRSGVKTLAWCLI